MLPGFLAEALRRGAAGEAVVWRGRGFSFDWLAAASARWRRALDDAGVPAGSVVGLEADFSPEAIAAMLALIERPATVVPLTGAVAARKAELSEAAQVEASVTVGPDGDAEVRRAPRRAGHELLATLRRRRRAGLILFSSGSTGESKAAVHDFSTLLEKFELRRRPYRTLTFLLFDHIGGINTLFYALANGGCVVAVEDRSPDAVCAAIARHRVQLLPTSPTFLNLLLAGEAYRRHDLSSLELVTYGTEVMPEATLARLRAALPEVRLQQTYGLSEVGILRSKSRSSDSLWMKIGGEGFETRVVDGLLQVRARSAMLGYLNAPSPFTADGWLDTGDAVEVDGEYLRVLGRRSEIINVGGEKVFPAEVESVVGAMDGVEEVMVLGAANAITGQHVEARVRLTTGESLRDFRHRMYEHCRARLPRYKIPQSVVLADDPLHGDRFKMIRRAGG